jgi:hypothetical protein
MITTVILILRNITSIIITFLHILQILFVINVYMVLFLYDNVIYVFLLLWLCILILRLCMTNLTEVLPCLFLSCKANARVNPAKTGHGLHSSKIFVCSMYFCVVLRIFCVVLCIVCFESFSLLFVCICVLNYCHRVTTQLQLNISYHMCYIVRTDLKCKKADIHVVSIMHYNSIACASYWFLQLN